MSVTSVKLFPATKMKCAVVPALISLAFVSQAFAVLRPLFPAKPAPPFNGELIIIGDDSVLQCTSKRLLNHERDALSPLNRRGAMTPRRGCLSFGNASL